MLSWNRGQWTPEEIARFKELALLKHDKAKSLEIRSQAASGLSKLVSDMPRAHVIPGLAFLGQYDRAEFVRFEAIRVLMPFLGRTDLQWVCMIVRDRHVRTRVDCAKCGNETSQECHSGGRYAGAYCRACCPNCALSSGENLKEMAMGLRQEPHCLHDRSLRGLELFVVERKILPNLRTHVN